MPASDRRPIECNGQRREDDAEDRPQAQPLRDGHRTVSRPQSPGPKAEDEEVITLPRLTDRVRGKNSPAERGTCPHVEVHRNPKAATEKKQKHCPPLPTIRVPVRRRPDHREERKDDCDRRPCERWHRCRA